MFQNNIIDLPYLKFKFFVLWGIFHWSHNIFSLIQSFFYDISASMIFFNNSSSPRESKLKSFKKSKFTDV